ncbi:MAG: hypothetical protein COV59_04445 [Candidatus Magasanikbacteria bacterium CG11_big_fil_rev_8_21_14_0_20_39_34]|uniref:Ribosomal RNA large subunit methyltransferase K/L-like methyltransferase domain-containing protein n=1 Tax=Candidatus Magasanikbacteria bacterium CG11_big_fil_rev_8_21_14_0_20_39_34 TaxID=1974653 RepID=A0A2H0N469_9BACT|nr:MAG: hypothetical protein COV59_04445 [Candidatus Magasanikbacteria bacterium CG11_big_fil_rev_8_21_14_0_20_39_34]
MLYLFELGHQPHISIAEIESVLKAHQVTFEEKLQTDRFFVLYTEDPLDMESLMDQLGGTKLMGFYIEQRKSIEQTIFEFLLENQTGKIVFSVENAKNRNLGIAIKRKLKDANYSARYIEYKNTATLLHNKLVEKKGAFFILHGEVFVISGIQKLEGFAQRDFDKPGVDAKSGMLPPKLARIMINLARKTPPATVLDPFCGSGVLLMEALDMGYHVVGSDNSARAIEDTHKNIEWIVTAEPKIQKLSSHVFLEDVRNISHSLQPKSIDIIATEPYMGKPLTGKEGELFLKEQRQELKDLYHDAFREFHTILKDDGVIIFIIPRFYYRKEWIIIDCLREILSLGFVQVPFNKDDDTLLYHRVSQHVGREIFQFVKK